MPGFPNSIIDEIRDKCNIVEVISQYIPLKQAGRNFRAHCPFHQEKTPSFMVSPAKGIFHCFGCGAGGNVFNFIMKHEGLEFPQVVRMLAQKTGVRLPATSMFTKERKDIQDLFQINELACAWYQDNLKQEQGRPALEYLKRRKHLAKTLLTFRLGFAPADNGLLKFMRSKRISEALLEKAGLVLKNERGFYYDRFKQRLIFPIFDSRSRILGFGGRVLDDSLPKYMNSPQTAIYSKGNYLYGLNFTKEELKKQDSCLVVEGYIDLLSTYQNGIANVVASLGTALTPQQIRLIKRYTHNVIMVFDADRAGKLAGVRSLDLLIEENMNIKVVALSEGEDPDSYISKFGAGALQEKILQAADFFEYKLKLLIENYDLGTVEGKVGIASQMLPTIRRVQNAIRRSGYVKRLAEEFSKGERSLGEEWILAELKKVKNNFEYYGKEQVAANQQAQAQLQAVCRGAEAMLLKIILEQEGVVAEIKEHLSLEDFQDLRIREVVRVVYRLHTQGQSSTAAKLISYLQNEDVAQLIARISNGSEMISDPRRCLNDCLSRIKKDNLKLRLNRLHREIKLAQSWGHKERLVELVSKYNCLMKEQVEKDGQSKARAESQKN